MRMIANDKGVALITALMFTVLGLVISMTLLYMVTSGIRTAGAVKRYKTALDATYGGSEVLTKDLIAVALSYSSSNASAFNGYVRGQMGSINPTLSACLQMRLDLPRKRWSGACATVSGNPKESPDISFPLNAASGTPYTVYSKIVDSTEWRFTSFSTPAGAQHPIAVTKRIAGNSDRGGNNDISKGGTVRQKTPELPHYPYMYRIEIQGERQQNPMEKGNISVMYAY